MFVKENSIGLIPSFPLVFGACCCYIFILKSIEDNLSAIVWFKYFKLSLKSFSCPVPLNHSSEITQRMGSADYKRETWETCVSESEIASAAFYHVEACQQLFHRLVIVSRMRSHTWYSARALLKCFELMWMMDADWPELIKLMSPVTIIFKSTLYRCNLLNLSQIISTSTSFYEFVKIKNPYLIFLPRL